MSLPHNFQADNNSDAEWYEVSKSHRCPICEKPDWCSATGPQGDPDAVVYMRIESDNQRGNGGWLHRLRENSKRGPGNSPQPSGQTAPVATVPSPSLPKSGEPTPFEMAIDIEEINKEHKHYAHCRARR